MKTLLPTLFAGVATALLMTGAARAELHTFHYLDVPLNAEFVKTQGDTIFLKADDGKLHMVGINRLEPDDLAYVNKMLGRPQVTEEKPAPRALPQQVPPPQAALPHPNLEVTWTKERSDSKQSAAVHNSTSSTPMGGGGFAKQTSSAVNKSSSNTYLLHIKVVNKSPFETGALEMHYQLCLSATENSYNTENRNKTTQKFKAGVIKCASLASGASTMVDTESFTLKTEDSQGYSAVKMSDGRVLSSDIHRKDEFKGVVVTFMRAGETVFEYVTPGVKKP